MRAKQFLGQRKGFREFFDVLWPDDVEPVGLVEDVFVAF